MKLRAGLLWLPPAKNKWVTSSCQHRDRQQEQALPSCPHIPHSRVSRCHHPAVNLYWMTSPRPACPFSCLFSFLAWQGTPSCQRVQWPRGEWKLTLGYQACALESQQGVREQTRAAGRPVHTQAAAATQQEDLWLKKKDKNHGHEATGFWRILSSKKILRCSMQISQFREQRAYKQARVRCSRRPWVFWATTWAQWTWVCLQPGRMLHRSRESPATHSCQLF